MSGAMNTAKVVCIIFTGVTLAACGGGGVSSTPAPAPAPAPAPTPTPTPTPVAFTDWQSVPANGSVRLTGSTTEGTYNRTTAGQFGEVSSYNTPVAGAATVDLTYSAGSQTGVRVAGAQSSITFSNTDGSTNTRLAANPNVIRRASPSGASSLLLFDAPSAGYSHLSFGAWTGRSDTTGYIGAFHAGTLTPDSSIPTSGSATFNGSSVGYYSSINGAVETVISDVTLTANFSSRSISYNASNAQGSISLPGLNITGTLTWNAGSNLFTGTLRTPVGFGTGELAGPASGRFYGPNSKEVGGSFVLNWAGGTRAQYIGAFGAKRP